jgi:hypothetical protein
VIGSAVGRNDRMVAWCVSPKWSTVSRGWASRVSPKFCYGQTKRNRAVSAYCHRSGNVLRLISIIMFSSRKSRAIFEFAGAMVASYDLTYCVGRPGMGVTMMIMSIYLVIAGAWDLAG